MKGRPRRGNDNVGAFERVWSALSFEHVERRAGMTRALQGASDQASPSWAPVEDGKFHRVRRRRGLGRRASRKRRRVSHIRAWKPRLQSFGKSRVGDDSGAGSGNGDAQVRDIDAVKQYNARVIRKVSPDELMRTRVVELEYAKVPRPLQLLPDEVVGIAFDDNGNVVRQPELIDERGGAIERIGRVGVKMSEPGDAQLTFRCRFL